MAKHIRKNPPVDKEKLKKEFKPRPIRMEDWETEENLKKIYNWVVEGKLDYEIAELLGVTPRAWSYWKQYSEPIAAIYAASEAIKTSRVEAALYLRATGMKVKEVRTTSDGKVETVEKFLPPDTKAATFWLKNRDKDRWKDRFDNVIESNIPIVIDVSMNEVVDAEVKTLTYTEDEELDE